MRTRQSRCIAKKRFTLERDAILAALAAEMVLRVYRCDRCGHFHLTSRTRGKRLLRPVS